MVDDGCGEMNLSFYRIAVTSREATSSPHTKSVIEFVA
jgi:hypothetical protein